LKGSKPIAAPLEISVKQLSCERELVTLHIKGYHSIVHLNELLVVPIRKPFLLVILFMCLSSNFLFGQTGIATISTTTTAGAGATANDYTDFAPSDASGSINDNEEYSMFFGIGNNLFVSSYTVSGNPDVFDRFVKPDTLIIRRVDAGTQLVIFYEFDNVDNGPTPNTIDIDPDIVLDEEGLYRSDLLNAGYDNILVNDATNFANVERVDVIWYTGILTSTPGNAMIPLVDRGGGNDNFKIAAITGLDVNGVLSAYSSVVDIVSGDFINTSPAINHNSLVMRRQDISSNPLPQTTLSTQQIEGVAVSFTELGISANQIIYGYSIFASDVTATGTDLADFTNQTFYPRNTGSSSGLDLIAGISTAVANDDNLRRSVGPGGYKADLDTWLKANVLDSTGTTTSNGNNVIRWDDKWTRNNDAVNTLGTAGTLLDGSGSGLEDINFNATVDFVDATERGLAIVDSDDFNTASSYEKKSINIAFRTGNNVTVRQQIFEQGGTTRGLNLYIRNGSLYAGAWNENAETTTAYNDDFIHIALATRDESTGNVEIFVDSESAASGTGATGTLSAPGNFGIANHSFPNIDAQFSGDIAESIVFNRILNENERTRVDSYLALKYSITRVVTGLSEAAEDYRAGDDGIIWDIDAQGELYHNDIFGIGRDDLSCFEQIKSKSENSDALVTFDNNGSFATDDSWLISGNDNAVIEAVGNLERPSGIKSRLNREWKVQETGSVGTIRLSYDLSTISGPSGIGTNNLNLTRLMVDDDGNFGNGGTTLISPVAIDGSNDIVTFEVDFTSGQYYTLGSEEVDALPVELLSFNAKAQGQTIQLNWSTANETNNSFFTIERSANGSNFSTLATVDGAGNSTERLDYAYTDMKPINGFNFYRLKQTDLNGNFEYSSITLVDFVQNEKESAKVYPNPVNQGETLHLNYFSNAEQNAQLSLINSKGQQFYQKSIRLSDGVNELTLDTSTMRKGIYLLRLTESIGATKTFKVIIK